MTSLHLSAPTRSTERALASREETCGPTTFTADLEDAKLRALAKAERAFYERLQASDAAFLEGLTARSAGLFSVATATAALVGGSLVLGAAKALSGQAVLVKVLAFALAVALLFFVGKAMRYALDAMRPGEFYQADVVEDFIGLAWSKVSTENPEADADRFLSEMTRDEATKNRKLMQPRFDILAKAVDALKMAVVLALVLVALATAITTFSADEKERSSEAASPAPVTAASAPAQRSTSKAYYPARAETQDRHEARRAPERAEVGSHGLRKGDVSRTTR